MPSGAKKRKAAKKKKYIQSHVLHSGTEEVKSHDERDSDGAETGSPVSEDQNPFKGENEDADEKKQGSNKGAVENGPPVWQERGQDEEVVEVISVVESIEGSESKDVDLEDDKFADELNNGTNNGSAKFYEYESRLADKLLEEEHVATIPVLETVSAFGSVKSDLILSDVTSVTAECKDECQVAEMRSEKENVLEISVPGTAIVDYPVKSIDNISQEVTDVTEKEQVNEANGSVLITSPIVDSAKQVDSSSKEVVCAVESTRIKDSFVSGSNELYSKETEDKMLPNMSDVCNDSLALTTKNKVFCMSDAKVHASSIRSIMAVSAKENEITLPSATQTEIVNDNNGKEPNNPECSKDQRLLSSIPPQTKHKTSWLSCCGLLDVFSGSGR